MRTGVRRTLLAIAPWLNRLPDVRGRERLFALTLRAAQRLGPPIISEVDGFSLQLDMRDGLCRGIWVNKGFSQGATLKSLCRQGDIVIDVGANIGHMALMAARVVGPDGRVIAIEPGERSFSLLQINARRNFPNRIQPIRAACDEADGTTTLYVSEYSEELNSLRPDTVLGRIHKETLPARSLRTLCAELDVEPDVIKIDVEGAEWPVLRGLLGRSGRKPRALLVEAYLPNTRGFGYRPSEMCAWLEQQGYELSLTRDRWGAQPFPYSSERADGPLLHDVVALRHAASDG